MRERGRGRINRSVRGLLKGGVERPSAEAMHLAVDDVLKSILIPLKRKLGQVDFTATSEEKGRGVLGGSRFPSNQR